MPRMTLIQKATLMKGEFRRHSRKETPSKRSTIKHLLRRNIRCENPLPAPLKHQRPIGLTSRQRRSLVLCIAIVHRSRGD